MDFTEYQWETVADYLILKLSDMARDYTAMKVLADMREVEIENLKSQIEELRESLGEGGQ